MHPSLRAARAPAEGQVEEDCGDSCLPLIPNPSPKGEGRGADWYDLEMTTRTSPTLLAAAALLAGTGATAAPAAPQGTACKVIPAIPNATLTTPYTGDCRNGLAHGRGKYTVTIGTNADTTREYAGEFAEGKLNGRAAIVTTTTRGTTRIDAFYSNNEPNGPYRIVLPDGRVGSLEYRKGKIWSGVNQGLRNGVPFAARWINGRQVSLCLGDRSNELNCTPSERAELLEGAAPALNPATVTADPTKPPPDPDLNTVAGTPYGKAFPPLGGAKLGEGPKGVLKLSASLQKEGYKVFTGNFTTGSFPELLGGGVIGVKEGPKDGPREGQVVMTVSTIRGNKVALIKRSEMWPQDNLPLEEVFLNALRDRFGIPGVIDNFLTRVTKGALEWGVTPAGKMVTGDECFREKIEEAGYANAAFGKLFGGEEFPRGQSDFMGFHPISARVEANGQPFCALFVTVQMYIRETPIGRMIERYDLNVTDVATLHEDYQLMLKYRRAATDKERQKALQNSPLPKF